MSVFDIEISKTKQTKHQQYLFRAELYYKVFSFCITVTVKNI